MKITDKMAVTIIGAVRHASDTGNPVVVSLEGDDQKIDSFTISPDIAVSKHHIGRSMNLLVGLCNIDINLYGDTSEEFLELLHGVIMNPVNGQGFEIVFGNHDDTKSMSIDAPKGIKFRYELEHPFADHAHLAIYELGSPNLLCGINGVDKWAELSGDPDGEEDYDFVTIMLKQVA